MPRPYIAASMGQSNSVGATSTAGAIAGHGYPTNMPFQYHIGGATDPVNWNANRSWGFFGLKTQFDGTTCTGPELDLGKRLEEVQPGQWAVVNAALSSSSLADHWNPFGTYLLASAGKNWFNQTVDILKAAEVDQGGKLKFIAWTQGEADAASLAQANAYETNMVTLLTEYRKHFPGVHICLARLNDDFSGTYRDTIRTAQYNLTRRVGFHMIDVDSYPMQGDLIHYPVSSHLLMGRLYADAWFTAAQRMASAGKGTRYNTSYLG